MCREFALRQDPTEEVGHAEGNIGNEDCDPMFEHRPAYVVSGVQLLRDSAPENATHTSARAGDYFVCCVREGPIHGESGGQPPTQFALDFGSIGCGSDQILKHGLPTRRKTLRSFMSSSLLRRFEPPAENQTADRD